MDFSLMIVEYMTGYFFNKMFWSWSWPLNCTLTYFSVIVDKHVVFLRQPFEKSSGNQVCPSQWGKLTLANVSAFWAGQVENWPGRVEFCIEHIKDTCSRNLVSHTGSFPVQELKTHLEIKCVFISVITIWISSENIFIFSISIENSSGNQVLSSFPWQLFESLLKMSSFPAQHLKTHLTMKPCLHFHDNYLNFIWQSDYHEDYGSWENYHIEITTMFLFPFRIPLCDVWQQWLYRTHSVPMQLILSAPRQKCQSDKFWAAGWYPSMGDTQE